jgi:uncharacterized protein
MNIAPILADHSQRTHSLPNKPWKYYQQWHNTVFLHWKVPAQKIEALLPPNLKVDLIDDSAWISLAAFEVKKMRIQNLPALPYISNFKEINVRTYVTHNGIKGIYLFSIETDKLIEVLRTRLFLGLPYIHSAIKKTSDYISTFNMNNNNYVDISYATPKVPVVKSPLDYWLTERHCLYNYVNNKLYRHDLHHREWQLKEIDISILDLNYDFNDLSLNGQHPDRVHFSKKMEVLLWKRKAI